MRLAAQAKGGFYPAAPEAVRHWARRIRPKDPTKTCILDPCCGKGVAVKTLGESLNLASGQVFAIELDEGRAEDAAANLDGARLVAPADFFKTAITPKSFSVIWCNPPFDDELGGGGRVETQFLSRCQQLLVKGGIIGFVLPERVWERCDAARDVFKWWFADVAVFRFPEEHRPFGEIVVTGARRDESEYQRHSFEYLPFGGDDELFWVAPNAPRLQRFEKCGPTASEHAQALAASPLRRVLEPPAAKPLGKPILPLSKGHVSLLLLSGQVDGIVHPPGEMAHVVRGVAKKEQYLHSQAESEDGDKSVTVYRERLRPGVRTVDEQGVLKEWV